MNKDSEGGFAERLNFAMDEKPISAYELSKYVGVGQSTLSDYRAGKRLPKLATGKLIASVLEVCEEWLVNGEGKMVKEKGASYVKESPKHGKAFVPKKESVESNKNLIPLYDGVVTASMLGNDLTAQTQPVDYIDAGDWFRDATAAMRVHGDSMFPEYKSGSILALKKVENKRLVIPGEDYAIETTEYRVIKRLQRSVERNSWLACSVNTEIWEVGVMKGRLIHEPFDINMDDVVHLYQVLGNVKRNHSSRIVKV